MRVCIYADNSCAYVNALLEIWAEANCAVLIDPRIPIEMAIEQMRSCGVERCYTDMETDEMSIRGNNISFIKIHSESVNCFRRKSSNELFPRTLWDKEALILFSSGTTGRAKGIIHTFSSIQKNANMIQKYMELDKNDKIYIVKSLAHSSAIVGELLVALNVGIPVFLGDTAQHIGSIWVHIIQNEITILCLNPTLLRLLGRYLTHMKCNIVNCKLRKIYTSGSIMEQNDFFAIKSVLKSTQILNVYGLTEAGPRVTAQRQELPLGSVGVPIGNVKVMITDEEGNVLSYGHKGIVSVKTDCLFQGYVSDSSYVRKSVYKDWLNTGDIGYLDENGELYIVGRADRMAICGGHNVYPEQIEEILLKFSKIHDCYVYSVDDVILGQKIICIYESDQNLNNELREYCRRYLASYEIPKEFIHGRIARTPNGKKVKPQF